MPELPEVETTRQGLNKVLARQVISKTTIYNRNLRWPIADNIECRLSGARIHTIDRRGKYLLFRTDRGTLIAHLGMSGSMRISTAHTNLRPHDHVLIEFLSGAKLLYHDPRRFGSMHWVDTEPEQHPLLRDLGPEPLGNSFTASYLQGKAAGRKVAIKNLVMDARVVVGVGNIYANEALFAARIRPTRAAGRVSKRALGDLCVAVREILTAAIEQGGTTLRDFVNGAGEPGYFAQSLSVYGRKGEPCTICSTPIKLVVVGQRASYYCPNCQR